MGRPTKYNEVTVTKLLDAIRKGYTVKMACKCVDITDMTLGRWRDRYPDFNKRYIHAANRQWENIEALQRCGIRTYKRKMYQSYSLPYYEPEAP